MQESLEHSWQVRQMLIVLGGYKWVLTGIDTDFGLGFVYPVVDANAQSSVKKNQKKKQNRRNFTNFDYCHSFRPKNMFYSA